MRARARCNGQGLREESHAFAQTCVFIDSTNLSYRSAASCVSFMILARRRCRTCSRRSNGSCMGGWPRGSVLSSWKSPNCNSERTSLDIRGPILSRTKQENRNHTSIRTLGRLLRLSFSTEAGGASVIEWNSIAPLGIVFWAALSQPMTFGSSGTNMAQSFPVLMASPTCLSVSEATSPEGTERLMQSTLIVTYWRERNSEFNNAEVEELRLPAVPLTKGVIISGIIALASLDVESLDYSFSTKTSDQNNQDYRFVL